ncbi:MAG: hypothetical protein GF387_00160 [Candidatus Portnoybacteria bacterium]|nr:hypothetical protein [Candidatus Portnoybacteria bacterium]
MTELINDEIKEERTLKKLIINEIILVVIFLVVFILFFHAMDGWDKTGQEKYRVILGDSFATAAFFGLLVFIFVNDFIVHLPALAIAVSAFSVSAVFGSIIAGDFFSAVGVVIFIVSIVLIFIAVAATAKKELKAVPKKKIYASLGAEATIIVLIIISIGFLL